MLYKSGIMLLMVVSIALAKLPPNVIEKVKIAGICEYKKGSSLIIDGQNITSSDETKFKDKIIKTFSEIPLGSKVKVKGFRMSDGSVLAEKVEVDENKTGILEFVVIDAADELESSWNDSGFVSFVDENKERYSIGRIVVGGNDVKRVNTIFSKIKPSYISERDLKLFVVDNSDWNAFAMPNGTIIVYSGLIKDLTDDDLAIVLGHELAHYTYSHSYSSFKLGLGTKVLKYGLDKLKDKLTDDEIKQNVMLISADLAEFVGHNQYSQINEEQADRVGLRYAAEAGYNPKKGPEMWEKFNTKYKDSNAITNFFIGSHPTFEKRKKLLIEEIKNNY